MARCCCRPDETLGIGSQTGASSLSMGVALRFPDASPSKLQAAEQAAEAAFLASMGQAPTQATGLSPDMAQLQVGRTGGGDGERKRRSESPEPRPVGRPKKPAPLPRATGILRQAGAAREAAATPGAAHAHGRSPVSRRSWQVRPV